MFLQHELSATHTVSDPNHYPISTAVLALAKAEHKVFVSVFAQYYQLHLVSRTRTRNGLSLSSFCL